MECSILLGKEAPLDSLPGLKLADMDKTIIDTQIGLYIVEAHRPELRTKSHKVRRSAGSTFSDFESIYIEIVDSSAYVLQLTNHRWFHCWLEKLPRWALQSWP